MMRLLKIEWAKVWPYRPFRLLFIGYFAGVIGLYLIIGSLVPGPLKTELRSIYDFPQAWHHLGYLVSWFAFFPAMLILITITNEFNFGTARQNIIDGISRAEFLWSKISLIGLFTVFSFVAIVGAVALGAIFFGDPSSFSHFFEGMDFLLGSLVQLVNLMLFGMMIAFLTKKMGLGMIIFSVYVFPVEIILWGILTEMGHSDIIQYFPLKSNYNIVTFPFLKIVNAELQMAVDSMDIVINSAWSTFYVFVSFYIVRKKDMR